MAAVAVLVTWSLAACGTTGDVSVQTPVTPTAPGVQAATRDAGRGGSEENGPVSGIVEGAEVIAVVDGDTLRVRIDGGVDLVRMTGIDTPEVSGPYRDAECFGDEASRLTASLVPAGAIIALERDVSDRDPFDRLLRSVWTVGPDGSWTLINEAIVAAGAAEARAYPPDTSYADRLDAAEAAARSAGRGMWSACPTGSVEIVIMASVVRSPPTGDIPAARAIPDRTRGGAVPR